MLQKTLEISILYDFYSGMLTEKQRDIVDLYYNHDLSLGEIAEGLKISRQAVYDMVKRTERLLYQYEENLGFLKLLQNKSEKIMEILDKVTDLENNLSLDSSSKKLQEEVSIIKNDLSDFLNN